MQIGPDVYRASIARVSNIYILTNLRALREVHAHAMLTPDPTPVGRAHNSLSHNQPHTYMQTRPLLNYVLIGPKTSVRRTGRLLAHHALLQSRTAAPALVVPHAQFSIGCAAVRAKHRAARDWPLDLPRVAHVALEVVHAKEAAAPVQARPKAGKGRAARGALTIVGLADEGACGAGSRHEDYMAKTEYNFPTVTQSHCSLPPSRATPLFADDRCILSASPCLMSDEWSPLTSAHAMYFWWEIADGRGRAKGASTKK